MESSNADRQRPRGRHLYTLPGALDSVETAAALGHGGWTGHLSAFAGTCCAGRRGARGLALGAAWERGRAGLRKGGGPDRFAPSGARPPRPPPHARLCPRSQVEGGVRGSQPPTRGSRGPGPASSYLRGRDLAPALHHPETGLSRFPACAEMGFRPGRGCPSRLSPESRGRGCFHLFPGPCSVAS